DHKHRDETVTTLTGQYYNGIAFSTNFYATNPIVVASSGVVSNSYTPAISGTNYGWTIVHDGIIFDYITDHKQLTSGGFVENHALIGGYYNIVGVDISGGAGFVSNSYSGIIDAHFDGVAITNGGEVVNYGAIYGRNIGVYVNGGGIILNFGSI